MLHACVPYAMEVEIAPEIEGVAFAAPSIMTVCHNCKRFTPVPFKHSFSTALEQTKNQSWKTHNSSWMVTPTASLTPALANTVFCSGDCLFSFLFSNELLSSRSPDLALHFFKRTDEQRQWLASQQPVSSTQGVGSNAWTCSNVSSSSDAAASPAWSDEKPATVPSSLVDASASHVDAAFPSSAATSTPLAAAGGSG